MARTSTPAAPRHHLQEPVTGLYYARQPDGGVALNARPSLQTEFHTSAQAIEYATQRLPGQACELVRVAG